MSASSMRGVGSCFSTSKMLICCLLWIEMGRCRQFAENLSNYVCISLRHHTKWTEPDQFSRCWHGAKAKQNRSTRLGARGTYSRGYWPGPGYVVAVANVSIIAPNDKFIRHTVNVSARVFMVCRWMKRRLSRLILLK